MALALALAAVAPASAQGPAAAQGNANAQGFEHAPTVDVDGEDYYLDGAPDGPDGATDIPGHYWVQAGPDRLVGKHYNTGPFGDPQWWSSDAADGEFLYVVSAIIDTWSEEQADAYADRGYVHYHELVSAVDGALHPTKVLWLKHTARTSFSLDRGPHPELDHDVTPGIDTKFIPNGTTEYDPDAE
jgi:selenium-binding protein 1